MSLTELLSLLVTLGLEVDVEDSLVTYQRRISIVTEVQNLKELVSGVYQPASLGIYRINFGYETLTFKYVG